MLFWIFPKCIVCCSWWQDSSRGGHSHLIKYQRLLTRISLFCRHVRTQQKPKLYIAEDMVRDSTKKFPRVVLFFSVFCHVCRFPLLMSAELPLLIHCGSAIVHCLMWSWSLLSAPCSQCKFWGTAEELEYFGWNFSTVSTDIDCGVQLLVGHWVLLLLFPWVLEFVQVQRSQWNEFAFNV